MKVIGIDPGYERMGVAIVEKTTGPETVLFSDCVTTPKTLSFPDRLVLLGSSFGELLTRFTPDTLAIEKLFITTNQKTATNVAEVRGMLIYLARAQGLAIREFTPLEIKMTISGYGKATKNQVTAMVGKLVRLETKKRHDDEYDAIGTALTCLARPITGAHHNTIAK